MFPLVLNSVAHVRLMQGDLDSAAALLDEADAIAAATGASPVVVGRLSLAGYRGNKLGIAGRSHLDRVLADATRVWTGAVPGANGPCPVDT